MTENNGDNQVTPPAYLQEKLDDLLHPRLPRSVVVTYRAWMEPYYNLEEGELGARFETGRAHYQGLVLWLRQIALFRTAFSHAYDWSNELDQNVGQAIAFRLDLLGLAGTNSKLVLDALMAGYYSGCMALERHMLETWRRVAYARLSPDDIWRWYPQDMWPDDVLSASAGETPTEYPSTNQIVKKINDSGTERDKTLVSKVQDGFKILNDHAHPTIEGTTQSWDPDDPSRRVFGPTFSDPHCRRCLTWGLCANAMLLEELALIDPQGEDWLSELNAINVQLGSWLTANQN